MDLQKVGCGGIDWIDLIRMVTGGGEGGCCECCNELSGSVERGEFLE
jgi:hypothetical protein